jgi:VanZ family protein
MLQKLLLLVITLLMLAAGFWQKGTREPQPPVWQDSGSGLSFNGQTSFAYAERFPAVEEAAGLAINLAIKPEFPSRSRFGVLLELFDRFDEERIVLAQWDKSLMVLNSDDFSNKAKKPKIYAELPQDNQVHDLSIQSNANGTRVYIDGEMVGQNKNLQLRLPQQPNKSYVVVGNGVRTRTPWNGTIYSLAVSQMQADDTGLLETGRPLISYKFDEGEGSLIRDYSPNMVNLSIPEKPILLLVSVLDVPAYVQLKDPWMKRDLVLNFIGFIPFGFLLAGLLLKASDNSAGTAVLLSFLISFLFSLSIELTQVLLPQRTSSMVDLVLNSLGGLCGAGFALVWRALLRKLKSSPAQGGGGS